METSTAISIFLNAESQHINADTSIQLLVKGLALPDENAIAIALNDAVVPRSQWENTLLSNGDKVLMIQAAAGG